MSDQAAIFSEDAIAVLKLQVACCVSQIAMAGALGGEALLSELAHDGDDPVLKAKTGKIVAACRLIVAAAGVDMLEQLKEIAGEMESKTPKTPERTPPAPPVEG